MNTVANSFVFGSRPAFEFGQQRWIVPSRSAPPLVNGVATVPPAPFTSSPSSAAAHPYPVLADFLISLHSSNTGLAAEMFLQSWDEDHERAMTFIGALLYSSNGSHVLESFVRALFQSRENSLDEFTRLLMLMHRI